MTSFDRFDDTPTPPPLRRRASAIGDQLVQAASQLDADIRTGNDHTGWRQAETTVLKALHSLSLLLTRVKTDRGDVPEGQTTIDDMMKEGV